MKRINCHQVTMNKVTVNLIIEPNKVSHWLSILAPTLY